MASREQKPNLAVILLLILVPLAGGLYWYLERAAANRPAPPAQALSPEGKAYVGNLKLAGVEMKATANYAGAAIVEITGQITNNGDKTLDRAELSCVFFDPAGLVVFRERVPIVKSTLRPGETRKFRLPFEGIPQSWNQALPQLVIASVTFAS